MAYEVEFLLEGRHGLVTFVQNIAHQLGQYLDGVFGLLGVEPVRAAVELVSGEACHEQTGCNGIHPLAVVIDQQGRNQEIVDEEGEEEHGE